MTPGALSNQNFEEIKSLANSTIHELVFMVQHAEDNQLDDAINCMDAVNLNIHQITDLLEVNRRLTK